MLNGWTGNPSYEQIKCLQETKWCGLEVIRNSRGRASVRPLAAVKT